MSLRLGLKFYLRPIFLVRHEVMDFFVHAVELAPIQGALR